MGTVLYSVLVLTLLIIYDKISYGEMVSYLPVPGGFFALANRTLSPALVSTVY